MLTQPFYTSADEMHYSQLQASHYSPLSMMLTADTEKEPYREMFRVRRGERRC